MDLNMNLWILYANCDDKMTALIKMIIFTEDKIMQPKKIFSENLLCEYSTFLYSASAQKWRKIVQYVQNFCINVKFLNNRAFISAFKRQKTVQYATSQYYTFYHFLGHCDYLCLIWNLHCVYKTHTLAIWHAISLRWRNA